MKPLLRRYAAFLFTSAAFLLFLLVLPTYRDKAMATMTLQATTMLLVIPPIFILLGLLDVWVPREVMIRLTGEKSGVVGIVLSFRYSVWK